MFCIQVVYQMFKAIIEVGHIVLYYLQEALRALWHAAFPNIVLRGLISEQWKDMGWQGPNPSTDFR